MRRKIEVTIRKFTQDDVENKVRWNNDPRNNQYLHYDLPLEVEKTRIWFENNKNRTDRFDAVVEVDGAPVGLIGLLAICPKNRKAEYYVCLGEQSVKGKGVASKASLLLLKYAFEVLGLNKVYLYTERENIAAQRLFERIGFEKEGLLKEDLIQNGRKIDRFFYGCTKQRFDGATDAD